MTNEEIKIREIEHNINLWIDNACKEYKTNGRSDWYHIAYNRIIGMIDVLKILTEKDYFFDENGLHEEKGLNEQ